MDKIKTAVILCIVIIIMLGAVLYACRDKFLPNDEAAEKPLLTLTTTKNLLKMAKIGSVEVTEKMVQDALLAIM